MTTKKHAKVLILGSGPAGLAVAEQLAERGHSITVYEYWPEPGGVLVYGIPNFKMRKNIVDEYIAHLEAMGVTFIYGVLVVLFNLVADIIYAFLDPRIKYA